jgi:hypothetical protein
MSNYVDPIEEQYNRIQASKKREDKNKKKVAFDAKNYLSVKLGSKETEKKLNIRILKLTPDAETPFAEIHTHFLPSEKKNFICAKQTKGISDEIEKTCPFCDIKDEAKENQVGANEVTWNKLKEIYKQNTSTLNYIVRVIDRDDEDFGIKFWKFSEKTYNFIIELYRDNKVDGIDIFDYKNGKDLTVTIKKDEKSGNSSVKLISAKNKQTPLASTEEEINKLVTDEKVWSDVYGIKPYDYLSLLINGKEPFYDKSENKWVEKREKVVDTTDEDNDDEYNQEHESDDESNGVDSVKEGDDLPF